MFVVPVADLMMNLFYEVVEKIFIGNFVICVPKQTFCVYTDKLKAVLQDVCLSNDYVCIREA